MFYPSPDRRSRATDAPRRTGRPTCQIRAAACVLLLTLAAVPASAAPSTTQKAQLQGTLTPSAPSLTADGVLNVNLTAAVTQHTDYLEARIQMYRPSGALVYQKTEIRHSLDPGAHSIPFSRELTGLGVKPGRYEVKVRVRASGADPLDLGDRVYIYDPARQPLTFAPVLRFTFSPAVDPSGSFVIDPANLRPKREADALMAAFARDTDISATLALPPLMLEEWRRTSQGYRFAGPEGVKEVAAGEPVPSSYAQALDRLREGAGRDRVEVLEMPYAEPDVAGLESIDAVGDLAEHYRRGMSVLQANFGDSFSSGTLVPGPLTDGVLDVLEDRETPFAVLPGPVRTEEGTAQAGLHRLAGSDVRALVADEEASTAMRTATAPADVLDMLFERYMSDEPTSPVVAVVDLGFGSRATAEGVVSSLSSVADVPWARLSSASGAAKAEVSEEEVEPGPAGKTDAPAGYWEDVRQARKHALALLGGVGAADPEADSAYLAMLVSESRSWAGPDRGWGLADRGRAFSAASLRQSKAFLEVYSLSCQDLTLPGERGEIPIQVHNASSKTMTVTVEVSGRLRFPEGRKLQVRLRPQDNFLTVPVDLGTMLSDRVRVVLKADGIVLAESTMSVKASYLERLFIVATVVVVLIGMLLGIRHKVRSSEPYNVD